MDALKVERRRTLLTVEPPQAGRRSHASAASGIVFTPKALYVVADDEQKLAIFPVADDAPGRWSSVLEGDLPLDPKARKAAKADFELLLALPAMPSAPHGALLALGSGSTKDRRTGALLPFDAAGELTGARLVDLNPLYRALDPEFGALNIEGAALSGPSLLLLQRGNDKTGQNAIVQLDLGRIVQSLETERALEPHALRFVTRLTLPKLEGVPLTFTDAAPLPGSGLLFSAVAEDTDNPYDDGACKGSVIGALDAEGTVRKIWTVPGAEKVEGVALGEDKLWLVTDADDPEKPAQLLIASLT